MENVRLKFPVGYARIHALVVLRQKFITAFRLMTQMFTRLENAGPHAQPACGVMSWPSENAPTGG